MTRERNTTKEDQLIEARPQRVPLHEQRKSRMLVNGKDPNYVYRWVNDTEERIEQFKLSGYTVVEHKVNVGEGGATNDNVSVGSGARKDVGSGRKAVLMRIKKDLYEADQKAKQQEITKNEQMYIRKTKPSDAGPDGTYGEVSIGRSE